VSFPGLSLLRKIMKTDKSFLPDPRLRIKLFPVFFLFLLAVSGCSTYRSYNSLHWAKEAYKQGKRAQEQLEQQRKQNLGTTRAQQTQDAGGKVVGEQDFEEAARKCLSFLSQYQKGRKTDDALMLMAKAFYELRHYVQAENSLTTLLETQRKSKFRDDAQYYLVLVMLKQNDIPLAELGIERLLDEYPKSKYRPLAQYALGEKLFEIEDYERALEVFFGVRDNYPKFELKGEVLTYISRILFELERYEEALTVYQQLSKEGQNDLQKREGLLGTARCKSRMNLHEEALEIYQLALRTAKFSDERAEARVGINVEYTYLDRSPEAMAGFEKIILENQRTSASAAAWYELGLLYKGFMEHSRLDSIAVDSTELIAFALNSQRLKQLEGLSQRLLSLRLAEWSFTNVRKEDANSPLNEPAQAQIKDVQDLYDIFEQIEASDSASSQDALARLQFLLAEYHENVGQFELAWAEYERLLFEYPKTIWVPKATMNVARVSRELGDSVRYRQSLELVIENFPDTRYADRARDMIGLPVPERPPGFYMDELAAYVPPRITRAAAAAPAATAAGAARPVPGAETYLQMRRRLWWERFGTGGGV